MGNFHKPAQKSTFNQSILDTEKFSITRTRDSSPPPEHIVNIAPSDGFSIIIQLQDFAAHTVCKGQQLRYSGGYKQGAVSIPYRGDDIRCQHRAAYDNLKIYIPRTTPDEIQMENGAHKISSFNYNYDTHDRVIYHLAHALLSTLQIPATFDAFFIDSALLAKAAGELSSKLIPHATFKVIPAASHGMCTVNADTINAALLEFSKG